MVRLGESTGGYRLIAVGESEAVIRVGTRSRTLRLYPAVDVGRPDKAKAVADSPQQDAKQDAKKAIGDRAVNGD